MPRRARASSSAGAGDRSLPVTSRTAAHGHVRRSAHHRSPHFHRRHRCPHRSASHRHHGTPAQRSQQRHHSPPCNVHSLVRPFKAAVYRSQPVENVDNSVDNHWACCATAVDSSGIAFPHAKAAQRAGRPHGSATVALTAGNCLPAAPGWPKAPAAAPPRGPHWPQRYCWIVPWR